MKAEQYLIELGRGGFQFAKLYTNKRMTFEEWAEVLDLREKLVPSTVEVERKPWRCTGCDQLMYGVEWADDRQYPSPLNTPAGLFISKEQPHVCHVCWEMYHALEQSSSGYWQGLGASDRKNIAGLRPGDNYLTT